MILISGWIRYGNQNKYFDSLKNNKHEFHIKKKVQNMIENF